MTYGLFVKPSHDTTEYPSALTGDTIQVLDTNDAVALTIDENGNLGVGCEAVSTIEIIAQSQATTNIPIVAKAYSGQTGALFQTQTSAGAALWSLDKAGRELSAGTVATASAGADAGATPPSPVITGTDVRGTVTFGTGTEAVAGHMASVTFSTAYASAPIVQVQPLNAATAALVLFANTVTANGFKVSGTEAPTSSQANTVYAFSYIVKG